MASFTSLLPHGFTPHHSLHSCGGFAYHTAILLDPALPFAGIDLAFSVIPSLMIRVQEYQPVVHRLRFSASS